LNFPYSSRVFFSAARFGVSTETSVVLVGKVFGGIAFPIPDLFVLFV